MGKVALALVKISVPAVINMISGGNNTPLMMACKNKMTDVALKIIEKNPTNGNFANNRNKTALIIACENDMKEVAVAMLKMTGDSAIKKNDMYFAEALKIAKRKRWVLFNPYEEELTKELYHPSRFQHSLRKHGYTIDTGDYQEVGIDDDNTIINPPENKSPKRFGIYSEKPPYISTRSKISGGGNKQTKQKNNNKQTKTRRRLLF